ncbi:MAG: hypothetical protein WC695_10650 [Candidatus Omnitrophota bacterium]
MGKRVLLVVIAVILCSCIAGVVSAEAGIAKVYGKVVGPDGVTPEASVKVMIQVADLGEQPEFPWATKTVTTDAKGNYTAYIYFPAIVEVKFVARAIKTSSLPFKEGSQSIGFYDKPPVNNASYCLNIKMKNHPNAVLLKGQIKDAETGLPINGDINIWDNTQQELDADTYWANSDGTFEILHDVATSPSAIYVKSPKYYNETRYNPKTSLLTVKRGSAYALHYALVSNKKSGYIHGTVVDISTGKPIPFAKMYITSPTWCPWCYDTVVTNSLGTYKQSISETGTYGVRTHGAHTEVNARTPYLMQSRGVDTRADQISQVDFEMVRK